MNKEFIKCAREKMVPLKWQSIFSALTLFTLSLNNGCSVRPRSEGETSSVNKAVVPVRTASQRANERPAEYRLGYGDVVEVKFFNDGQYNETVPVRPDGRISLQRVGDLNVVGMSPAELDKIVTNIYSEILLEPDVTILVREFGGQQCYVMGEVEKPGSYPIVRGMTLMRAIATAGGAKGTAKLNSVLLIRGDENQKAEIAKVDIDLSSLATNPDRDIPVRAFDVIYVPRTFIADVNSFVTQFYDIILPPLDIYTRYKYWYN
jgi:polysaccharide export outer membrane protein